MFHLTFMLERANNERKTHANHDTKDEDSDYGCHMQILCGCKLDEVDIERAEHVRPAFRWFYAVLWAGKLLSILEDGIRSAAERDSDVLFTVKEIVKCEIDLASFG